MSCAVTKLFYGLTSVFLLLRGLGVDVIYVMLHFVHGDMIFFISIDFREKSINHLNKKEF